MKLVLILLFALSIGFANTQKELCTQNLKDLYKLKVKLQNDTYKREQSFYEHNIYAAELYMEFIQKDIKEIKVLTDIALSNCREFLSEDEYFTLKNNHFYNGKLIKKEEK